MKKIDIESILKKSNQTYRFGKLNRKQLAKNPFDQFLKWFYEGVRYQVLGVNAMALATSSKTGKPGVRMVLLKKADSRGFVFFTNYQSPKAEDLLAHPEAELVFYWAPIEKQIRIRGKVSRISRKETEDYFKSRPRDSQLAAWISQQSKPIDSRQALEAKVESSKKTYEGIPIPCPPFWGGFRLRPSAYEFWQGRQSRLNDRFRYTRKRSRWHIERLQP